MSARVTLKTLIITAMIVNTILKEKGLFLFVSFFVIVSHDGNVGDSILIF
jgi:hypothetical protein